MSDGLDRAIAALAAGQHGNVTRAQLLDVGLGADAILYRARIGRLHRVHNGVYAIGHAPVTPRQRAAAAVLACGPRALLSHRSAAALWGIRKQWPSPVEVTTPSGHSRRGIKIHRSGRLEDQDATRHFGIAVTSPARTIFDIADGLSDAELARAVNDARLARYLSLADLKELLQRFPTRPATKRLRRFADSAQPPTRSHFERQFLAFVARYGLPRPLVNQTVAGHEVDILFPEHDLIVELDGYDFHSDRTAFERDRDRDADELEAGLRTFRLTWERFIDQPAREAARLQAIIDRPPTRRDHA